MPHATGKLLLEQGGGAYYVVGVHVVLYILLLWGCFVVVVGIVGGVGFVGWGGV
jgi:hypothetical protein